MLWLLKEPFVFLRRHSFLSLLQEEVIGAGKWIRRYDPEFIAIRLLPGKVHAKHVRRITITPQTLSSS